MRAVLDSLCTQGFPVTVIWRGCGGHDLRHLVTRYNDEDHGMRVHLPEQPFQALWSELTRPRPETRRLGQIPLRIGRRTLIGRLEKLAVGAVAFAF